MLAEAGKIRIGISGWRYKPWRGTFYPIGLAQRRELEYASERLGSIELNGSFYSLQRPESFAQWYEATPAGYQFAVKGSRFVTHMKKLRNVEAPLANFFAQGVLRLGDKLGPFLWQLPPNFKFNADVVEAFLALLPRDMAGAAELGRRHDARMDGRHWLEFARNRRLRHAMEIRNESFVCEEFVSLLRRYGVALVQADTVEWPLLMDVTADFVYCRLHGSEELYVSGYSAEALEVWAERVVTWSQGEEVEDGRKASCKAARKRAGRDVYVYFDNDAKVRSPVDAQELQRLVELRLRAGS